jgi:hypothetical protein
MKVPNFNVMSAPSLVVTVVFTPLAGACGQDHTPSGSPAVLFWDTRQPPGIVQGGRNVSQKRTRHRRPRRAQSAHGRDRKLHRARAAVKVADVGTTVKPFTDADGSVVRFYEGAIGRS